MVKVSLGADNCLADDSNHLTSVGGRVDLVRRDLLKSDQPINVVVANAAEDGDAVLNKK